MHYTQILQPSTKENTIFSSVIKQVDLVKKMWIMKLAGIGPYLLYHYGVGQKSPKNYSDVLEINISDMCS